MVVNFFQAAPGNQTRGQGPMKCAASSVLLTFEITAACDEFPATKRVRRGRRGAAAQKRIQRRCRKAMHAEHADASVRLQDRRSRIRYPRTRVAGIESQAEPRLSPHPRVLRASPGCICDEILALRCAGRCWRTHCQARVAAHAAGATPWQSACMAPVLVAANGCAAASVVQKT